MNIMFPTIVNDFIRSYCWEVDCTIRRWRSSDDKQTIVGYGLDDIIWVRKFGRRNEAFCSPAPQNKVTILQSEHWHTRQKITSNGCNNSDIFAVDSQARCYYTKGFEVYRAAPDANVKIAYIARLPSPRQIVKL